MHALCRRLSIEPGKKNPKNPNPVNPVSLTECAVAKFPHAVP